MIFGKKRRPFVLILLLFLFSSCFSKYIYTDKEIAEHYKYARVKPQFKSYTCSNRKIHYAEVGSDTLPLLILVHGAPGAWYGYMNIMDDSLLQSKFHIIAVDRPGYGKSNYGKKVTSIEQQSYLLMPLLDSSRSTCPATILGRSFGSPIAARMAIDCPERVGHLLLFSSAIDPELEKFWWFSKLGKWRVVRWMLPKALNTATDEKYAHPSELKKLEPLWKEIKIPVVVAQGGADEIVNPKNFDFAKKMLVNAKTDYIFLPEASHFITYNYPELLKEILLKQVN